ncbi:endonuclease domain-containing protein [Erythrobacter sp. EC-HK427]|uniref:endonuclease domain-containing protein n=1 Tax=Erythrobacter sp. EC-HK427 TaxID=2038396 RepID=UPI00351B27BA
MNDDHNETPRPLHRSSSGPPPRSGEDRGRLRHRTVGAPAPTVKRARYMRKNMTLPEVLLWQQIKGKKPKFRKQYPIGDYVVDFACTAARLLVEIDGKAHDMGDNPQRDIARQQLLEAKGWSVLRIPASEVLADPSAIAEGLLRKVSDQ